jgi:hypothetical protein
MKHLAHFSRSLIVFALCVASLASAGAQQLMGSGEWQSLSSEGIKGTWIASLTREGKLVDGSLRLTGSNVFTGGTVNGDINASSIMLGVMAEGTRQATFTGKLEGGKISGEWRCDAVKDQGVWWGMLVAETTGQGESE